MQNIYDEEICAPHLRTMWLRTGLVLTMEEGARGGADNDDAGDDGNSPILLTPTSRAGVPPNRTFKCRLQLRVLPWVRIGHMLLLMENGGQGFWCN